MAFHPFPVFPLPASVMQLEELITQSHKSLGCYMGLKFQIENAPNISGFENYLLGRLNDKFAN